MSLTRRQTLGWLAAGTASLCLPASAAPEQRKAKLSPRKAKLSPRKAKLSPRKTKLSARDEAFLDDMERRACLYFIEQASPVNGQVQDRAAAVNPDGKLDPRRNASIAATGFGLSALCIAHKRSYAPRAALQAQVLRTLRFHATGLQHEHGFFFHFNDIDTGKPLSGSEVSSIDTALLLCGVLTARAYFADVTEIVQHATTLYERADWPWMLNGGDEFSMGWNPDKGFLRATWNHHCELMMLPLLALGSPTHPVDAKVWTAWSRPTITYGGMTYISGTDPLFTHQYSHAWFDFRGRRDAYADYFQNSVTATRAQRRSVSISASRTRTGTGASAPLIRRPATRPGAARPGSAASMARSSRAPRPGHWRLCQRTA